MQADNSAAKRKEIYAVDAGGNIRYRHQLPGTAGGFISRDTAIEFAKENLLPDYILESANYGSDVLDKLAEVALGKGLPTFEDSIDFWKQNLAFDYHTFSDDYFDEMESEDNCLDMFWLSCRYIGQSKEAGTPKEEIIEKARNLFERTAAKRILSYPGDVASIAVIAGNVDRLIDGHYKGLIKDEIGILNKKRSQKKPDQGVSECTQ